MLPLVPAALESSLLMTQSPVSRHRLWKNFQRSPSLQPSCKPIPYCLSTEVLFGPSWEMFLVMVSQILHNKSVRLSPLSFTFKLFLQYQVKENLISPSHLLWDITIFGLPRWLSGKESACQCRRCKRRGFHP